MKELISALVALWVCLPITNTFGEGIDEYTVLMLHCNGKDGSTALIDSSSQGHIVAANGSSQIDTAQSKFGGASCLFDGGFKYFFSYRDSETLSVPDSDDWDFGSGDFTIDFWVYFDKTGDQWSSEANLVSQHLDADNYWKINYHSTFYWLFAYVRGGIQQIGMRGGTRPSAEAWHHVAVVRNGNKWNLYVDGTSVANAASSDAMPSLNVQLYIGGHNFIIHQNLKGWMDEIRISKGKARWTSDFTPPTVEY